MVNAADLKSAAAKAACGFEPRPRHWRALAPRAGEVAGGERADAGVRVVFARPFEDRASGEP